MPSKLISATELAEFVYCGKAWELKHIHGAEPSSETQQLQVEGHALAYRSGQAARPERQFPVGRFSRPCARCDPLPFRMAGVSVKLDPEAFEYWNDKTHAWVRPSGEFQLMVGRSSRDIFYRADLTVTHTSTR